MLRTPDRELPADHPDRGALIAVAARLDVPAGSIMLANSLAEFVEAALALRPIVRDAPRQAALTQRFFADVLPGLSDLLMALRAELDPGLRRAWPTCVGKAYPVGRCLEITEAVELRLAGPAPPRLCGAAAAEAWLALHRFRAAGGEVRRVWGDLRGEYFQNALLVGDLYVDVANDSVIPTKPPVEIRPLVEADFRPIADHRHFARIAARYWRHDCLPNHLAPELSPYLPFIQVSPDGGLRLGPRSTPMLGLTLAQQFRSSEAVLSAPPLAEPVFRGLRAALQDGPIQVAATAEQGREAALAHCRAYRADARFACAASFNRAMAAARAVNRRLARVAVLRRPT